MKKLFSASLIILLFVPIFGTYNWIKLETHLVKKSVKRKLIQGVDKSELTKLTFSPDQLATQVKWKHSKEFEYNGEMYDIVYTELEGEQTTYYCWWDEAESELNDSINTLTQLVLDSNAKHKTQKRQLQNIINTLYHSNSLTEGLIVFTKESKPEFYYHFNLKTKFNKVSSPPPQYC